MADTIRLLSAIAHGGIDLTYDIRDIKADMTEILNFTSPLDVL